MNRKIALITLIIGTTVACFAGGPPPHPSSGNQNGNQNGAQPGCWPPPCIPIDGGISLLIAAGAIYGGRKLYKNNKEENFL